MGKKRKKKKMNEGEGPKTRSQLYKIHQKEIKEFKLETKRSIKKVKKKKEEKLKVQNEREKLYEEMIRRHKTETEAIKPVVEESIDVMDGLFDQKEKKKKEKAKKNQEKLRRKNEAKVQKEKIQEQKLLEHQLQLIKKGGSKGEKELKDILRKLMMEKTQKMIVDISPDGDCLYSSLSHQLESRYSEKKSMHDIRKLIAFQMRENKKLYITFLDNDKKYNDYCNIVENSHEWGGQIEIKAFCDVMKCKVIIHTVENVIIMGEEYENKEEKGKCKVLHVSYHKFLFSTGRHYNSVSDGIDERIKSMNIQLKSNDKDDKD